jgi:hypothetical protein
MCPDLPQSQQLRSGQLKPPPLIAGLATSPWKQ